MTEKQQEILTGLMLGDGSLELGKWSKNACLRITRAAKDKNYSEWGRDMFLQFLTPRSLADSSVYDKRTKKTYPRTILRTGCRPIFTTFREVWYSKNKKIVPQNLQLTSLTVAVWFADDGNISIRGKKQIVIKLSTHGFTKQEVYLLSKKLRERYHFDFPVYEDDGHHVIIVSTQPALVVLRDIAPVFPPSSKLDEWKKVDWNQNLYVPPCRWCQSTKTYKNGKYETGKQKFKCKDCFRNFVVVD